MKTDLEYRGVEIDYERSIPDRDDDYGRNTIILFAEITDIAPENIVEELSNAHNVGKDLVLRYCFDRLCYYHDVYSKDSYHIEIGSGYYGEEIQGVYFENEEKVLEDFNIVSKLNKNIDRIRYILKLEYGYLLDEINGCKDVEVSRIKINDLLIPQKEHYTKLDKNAVNGYRNRKLPLCVCLAQENKYRILDGYHRIAANQDGKEVLIVAIK